MTKKPKICVYAISKNETQFVERFCESAKLADLILIADTGSTDDTVEVARRCGADVYSICISPWRFDHARNAALALVPRDIDICVSLDLDEVLEEGWREEIEKLWTDGVTRMRYNYQWGEGIEFLYEKIHSRHGYHWHHPCHEYPVPDKRTNEQWITTKMRLVTHHPDPSKSRGQYLDLLELSVKEDPHCTRNAFYYARELSFYFRWQESIDALNKFLAMPEATWDIERCYAYRVMGKCYEGMEMPLKAEAAYHRACAEASYIREPWLYLARFYYRNNRWEDCYSAAKRCLSITEKQNDYTCDPDSWGYEPDDLAAISAYRLGLREQAIVHGQKALDAAPDDEHLQGNMQWYLGYQEAAE